VQRPWFVGPTGGVEPLTPSPKVSLRMGLAGGAYLGTPGYPPYFERSDALRLAAA